MTATTQLWLWIAFMAPIISHLQETLTISKYLPSQIGFLNIEHKQLLLVLLIIFNFCLITTFYIFKHINRKDLFKEYLNLSVLGLLFYTTDLLISFGVYFGFWHSLSSTFDQIQFIKQNNLRYKKSKWIDLYLKSIPLSIIYLIFFLIAINTALKTQNLNSIIAYFFVFVAVITLPHTIIRELMYNQIYKG